MHRIGMIALACAAICATAGVADARDVRASLRGSAPGMVQQNRVAKEHGYDFYGTATEIEQAVEAGDLVEVTGNDDYEVAGFVQFPYARPEVLLFVERLAGQYRAACGQKLVVTSLTRPSAAQPANAHALSVHPAGMAVDLRVSSRSECRKWLESTLLELERRGVVDGIREYHPPHYHVAVFPGPYREYVDQLVMKEAATAGTGPGHAVAADATGGAPVADTGDMAAIGGMRAFPAARSGARVAGPIVLLAGAALLLAGPIVFPGRSGAWLPWLELARSSTRSQGDCNTEE
ncbi:MAG TPA: DUF5715 family protein [Longimicrobiales bacterium]|nr:DUF5715 family protein [Longimicrobiales bacterium]